MARECLCIEGNRKKKLRERERDRIESCPQPTRVSLHFQAKGKPTSPQHIKPFYCTSCFKLYCAVLSDCSAFVVLSYIVQINKMPILFLYCFVLFSFWLYLLLLTIKLNMGLLSLLWFKIWVFAKSNGGNTYHFCRFSTLSLTWQFWLNP